MPTIYDVAKRAGVSTYTVSSVLNRTAYVSPELTRRVQEAVRALDYTVNDLARSLQTRQTRTVGMLIPDLANPFYANVVRGVESVLKESGYSLILGITYNQPDEETRYLSLFRSKQADGILLFVSAGDHEDVSALVKARKPLVFVGRTPSGLAADTVAADNALGTQLAVTHLLGKGRRRIALINGQRGLSTSTDRTLGWKRALRKAGAPAPAELVAYGDWTAASGYAATHHLLGLSQPPDAIFAANFLMMTGTLKALQERGTGCPSQVEVMSSDDYEWLDFFEPRISTVVQPSFEMGAESASLLLRRIKSPRRRFEQILLTPRLHIRDA